jgi:hypothetical protein
MHKAQNSADDHSGGFGPLDMEANASTVDENSDGGNGVYASPDIRL